MTVLNVKRDSFPPDAVYIGRPTKWGNPYVIGKDGTREQVVEKYRAFLTARPDLMRDAQSELRGRALLCYCAPLPCHGDVLYACANVPAPPL